MMSLFFYAILKIISANTYKEFFYELQKKAFSQSSNICCPRDCVSRHNGGTAGAPLKPLRDDSALRALSSLRGLRGAPEVRPLCRETQSLGQQMLNAPVGINGLNSCQYSARDASDSACNFSFALSQTIFLFNTKRKSTIITIL